MTTEDLQAFAEAHAEVHGCDLLTFRDGKIALKNAYRKNRQP